MSHPNVLTLSGQDFSAFRDLLYQRTGIDLNPSKQAMVAGRLAKRLRALHLTSFAQYYHYINNEAHQDELETALDLLTTNETYFFREPKHFNFLAKQVIPAIPAQQTLRIWSAACSSGEEVYSLAMLLDQTRKGPWTLLGTDISHRMLELARRGHYPMERGQYIPESLLKRYCLKGINQQEGTFLIQRALRERVEFAYLNLIEPFPNLEPFDVILLRNVMIYFDLATKRDIVTRMLPLLRPGGYFMVSHSESLNGLTQELQALAPAIYRKPPRA